MSSGSPTEEDLQRQGFSLVPHILDRSQCDRLLTELPLWLLCNQERTAGLRLSLERHPVLAELATLATVRQVVEPMLGPGAFAVRALLFDKNATRSWQVPWHRDRTIAVQTCLEVPGYGPWSTKKGIPHVEPPRAVLEQMLAVRVHLDAMDEDNGPLRVIPGSHRDHDLEESERGRSQAICGAPALSALLMHPLLLHASSPSRSPRHRRVIHLEFAAVELQGGLAWYERLERLGGASESMGRRSRG